ncbi:hypothetical protein LLG88_00625 [bacterium]|nr:hypothetical protein [bacterium]
MERNDLPSGVAVTNCPPWTSQDQENLDREARYRKICALDVYSPGAALNSDQVAECRRLRRLDPLHWSIRRLAARFECGIASVCRVLDPNTIAPARPPSRAECGLDAEAPVRAPRGEEVLPDD